MRMAISICSNVYESFETDLYRDVSRFRLLGEAKPKASKLAVPHIRNQLDLCQRRWTSGLTGEACRSLRLMGISNDMAGCLCLCFDTSMSRVGLEQRLVLLFTRLLLDSTTQYSLIRYNPKLYGRVRCSVYNLIR